MPHPLYSGAEITRRGKDLYENRIRSLVETPENIGRIVSIDIDTGAYVVGDDLVSTGDRLFALHPGAALYGARIGYNAVYAVGGSLLRTDA
jgi:hypothetical protein